jgi:SAM-dependent methyltransferase
MKRPSDPVSDPNYRRLRRLIRPAWPAPLRRSRPLSECWGFDRGTPIDRYFIEQFLQENQSDIRGRVLEVKSKAYSDQFGRGVERADILDVDPTNSEATLIADLANATGIAEDQFDCFILTQTLQLIFDVRSAVEHAHRILRHGGVLLITVPVVSRMAPRYGLETDFWRFTPASCQELFGNIFGAQGVTINSPGNMFACVSFLYGMALEEVPRKKLEKVDPNFPLLVTVRAVKAKEPRSQEDL